MKSFSCFLLIMIGLVTCHASTLTIIVKILCTPPLRIRANPFTRLCKWSYNNTDYPDTYTVATQDCSLIDSTFSLRAFDMTLTEFNLTSAYTCDNTIYAWKAKGSLNSTIFMIQTQGTIVPLIVDINEKHPYFICRNSSSTSQPELSNCVDLTEINQKTVTITINDTTTTSTTESTSTTISTSTTTTSTTSTTSTSTTTTSTSTTTTTSTITTITSTTTGSTTSMTTSTTTTTSTSTTTTSTSTTTTTTSTITTSTTTSSTTSMTTSTTTTTSTSTTTTSTTTTSTTTTSTTTTSKSSSNDLFSSWYTSRCILQKTRKFYLNSTITNEETINVTITDLKLCDYLKVDKVAEMIQIYNATKELAISNINNRTAASVSAIKAKEASVKDAKQSMSYVAIIFVVLLVLSLIFSDIHSALTKRSVKKTKQKQSCLEMYNGPTYIPLSAINENDCQKNNCER